MISFQVTGWFSGSSPACWATDLRYQSNWVLAQNGAATSLSFHVEVVTAPSSTSCVSADASSSVNGRRKPASANSGTNTGSRLIMSIELSSAARRRTSCSRWLSASAGSSEISMR